MSGIGRPSGGIGQDCETGDGVPIGAKERHAVAHRLGWFAAPGYAWDGAAGRPLPLATLAGACNVRMAAETALDAAGLSWREAFVGGGVPAVGAAVLAGLGVAALAPSTAPPGAVEVGTRLGLPELPVTRVVLFARPLKGQAAEALRALAAAYRGPGGSR